MDRHAYFSLHLAVCLDLHLSEQQRALGCLRSKIAMRIMGKLVRHYLLDCISCDVHLVHSLLEKQPDGMPVQNMAVLGH